MPAELAALEFSLDDVVNGHPLTPENVDLPTLRAFLDEVETFIKGDVPGASLADSRVRIEPGSVKVVALVAQLLAVDAKADIDVLTRKSDLDSVQPKRAQIVERWQTRARRSATRSYVIDPGKDRPVLRVTKISQFQHAGENAWVSVEKYLAGRIVNAGGKQDPNIHLVLAEGGESVRVSASEEQLAGEKTNQLYKDVTLRVQAQEHLRTRALRNLRLMEFVAQTQTVDESGLATLWEKGRRAWSNVRSATGWVDELRGNL